MKRRLLATAFVGTLLSTILTASPAKATGTTCLGNAGSADGSVCLTVYGTGLYVESFLLRLVKNHADNCGTPTVTFSRGQPYLYQGAPRCAARVFEYSSTVVTNYPNQTQVCGQWSNYPRWRPCVTVHS